MFKQLSSRCERTTVLANQYNKTYLAAPELSTMQRKSVIALPLTVCECADTGIASLHGGLILASLVLNSWYNALTCLEIYRRLSTAASILLGSLKFKHKTLAFSRRITCSRPVARVGGTCFYCTDELQSIHGMLHLVALKSCYKVRTAS